MRENIPSKSNDMHELKNHPLIREYASVDDNIYEVIKATNPTLRMFVDLAKKSYQGNEDTFPYVFNFK
ncbi:MAG: hypothetical protein AWU59_1247 [Methanolobus sp. T82-4]|jgi:uncharacterized protein YutE (UPF0331/DUF86 family)|nr:MAG: hypothetical protein AWU59_1247 [Methanolobus sp. T82-4]